MDSETTSALLAPAMGRSLLSPSRHAVKILKLAHRGSPQGEVHLQERSRREAEASSLLARARRACSSLCSRLPPCAVRITDPQNPGASESIVLAPLHFRVFCFSSFRAGTSCVVNRNVFGSELLSCQNKERIIVGYNNLRVCTRQTSRDVC